MFAILTHIFFVFSPLNKNWFWNQINIFIRNQDILIFRFFAWLELFEIYKRMQKIFHFYYND